MSRWPDFVGIGAVKGGTTWLHSCLSEHPRVFLPVAKELDFFDFRYERGEDWYTGFFEGKPKNVVCGEITPHYMHDPRAFPRIAKHLKRTKFIATLRSPVDRAYSHFLMDARSDLGMTPLDKAKQFHDVSKDPTSKYVRYGYYFDQLEPYFRRFGKERMLVLDFADIEKRPEMVMSEVLKFLELEPEFVPKSIYTKINAAKRYRSIRVFRFIQRGTRLAQRYASADLMLRVKTSNLPRLALRLLEVRQDYQPMLQVTRRMLAKGYEKSVFDLESLTGKTFGYWLDGSAGRGNAVSTDPDTPSAY